MTSDEAVDKAVVEGIRLARGIFALRGNHSEIHLSEEELATNLALAFRHGIQAAINELHRMAKGSADQSSASQRC